MDFLEGMPEEMQVAIEGCPELFLCHGMPGNVRGNLDGWKTELLSIPYDADSFLKDFTESGLDELGFVLNRAVKKTVTTGINYVLKCVTEVEQETGLPTYLVPEEVWERVALKLGL